MASMTVADAITETLRRRSTPTDIDTIHERVRHLTGHKVARVTISTQLTRHRDRFERAERGKYRARKVRARTHVQ